MTLMDSLNLSSEIDHLRLLAESSDADTIAACMEGELFSGKCIGAVSISTFVRLRTALLYIKLYRPDITNIEKNHIRVVGLLSLFLHQKDYADELKNIDALLSGYEAEDIPLDVLKGGVVKVKRYYLETNKIKDIRGASLLLDSIDQERIPNLLREYHIPECLIYSGGGKCFALVPPECGESIRVRIEEMIEQVTLTANKNFVSWTTTAYAVNTKYQAIMAEMDQSLLERQGMRWNANLNPQSGNISAYVEDSKDLFTYEYRPASAETLCDRCRQRAAVGSILEQKDEPRISICLSCFHKIQYGGKTAKYSAKQQYLDYHHIDGSDIDYDTTESIAGGRGMLGVIYGDANNMSAAIELIRSPTEMRDFSVRTSETVKTVVYDALHQHLSNETRFEIIAVGGDDIFLLVPGDKAYQIALSIGEGFDKKYKDAMPNNITMSLGVCVTHHNFPIRVTFEIVQKLLKSAKKEAWRLRSSTPGGTMDFQIIENESAARMDVKEMRKEMLHHDPARTLRPYTWKQARAMQAFIASLKNEKSAVFNFQQTLFMMHRQEAELFFEYQLTKMKKPTIRNALLKLADEFSCNISIMNLKPRTEGNLKSPWLDAIELWDYAGGE